MSRIGKMPITVPAAVKLSQNGQELTVEGPKGKLTHTLPELISAKVDGGVMTIERANDSQQAASLHGLTRTLVNNMVVGVTEGFTKTLEIVGVGYRVALKGKALDFNVGKSHPTVFEPPAGIEFAVEGNNNIHVKGISK